MKNQNEMCQNDEAPKIIAPTKLVAEIAGVSESLVRKIRNGERNTDKGAGAKVAMIDDLFETGTNALIQEVKKVVKL